MANMGTHKDNQGN